MTEKQMKMTCLRHPNEEAIGRSMMVTMRWDPFVPMEVRMDTGSTEEWLFARTLLLEGLVQASGNPAVNEVLFAPYGATELLVVLVNEELSASFLLDREDVLDFLRPTVERIHPNDEPPLFVDWDVQFICLQAGATDLQFLEQDGE